ncbi:hypothetical protein BE61_24830 [Bradyrhizobium elkanii USDA 61]|nr:hypothetical protein BE61_24830 [Bradyrhizobium elkanii USDA 61]GEC59172.1 hypothetical protein BEL01nite_82150 [Bradyrhizobium elkanii]
MVESATSPSGRAFYHRHPEEREARLEGSTARLGPIHPSRRRYAAPQDDGFESESGANAAWQAACTTRQTSSPDRPALSEAKVG